MAAPADDAESQARRAIRCGGSRPLRQRRERRRGCLRAGILAQSDFAMDFAAMRWLPRLFLISPKPPESEMIDDHIDRRLSQQHA